jgi:general secretion pathway protein C
LLDRPAMELFFRKRLWIVNLVVIAICSIFAGRAAAHLIEASFLSDDAAPVPHPRFVAPPPPVHDKDPRGIVERNIFCSGCVPPDVQEKAVERAAAEARREPQKSTLQLALLAILLTDETSSAAVIRDLSTPQKDAALFARGSEVFATGASVDEVTERRVYLRHGDDIEYLDLDDKPAPPPPPAHPGMTVTSSQPVAMMIDHGINCTGSNCQIERALVEQALQNTAMLATSARFVPSIRDGRPNGFKVYAIRPNSLFARLGLQNGDTVQAINGNDMSTPDQALALYSKLRSASHLSVRVERRGSVNTLDYVIR